MTGPPALVVTVTETAEPPGLHVAVGGDLDHACCTELEIVFDHRLPGLPADARVVVDLSEVSYCDSAGLRVLLAVSQRLTDGGGALALAGVSGQPARAMRLTGLDTALGARG